ncbi:protein DEHYDRATION-INDUCED 19 homolog 2 isoform X1 [Oryza sativa Japonica Group]|uniref:protein DEHYDRATION-INDUCED 19 homolog 2 isoform X1 n=1 Tax=Oryza sativa subsp. japonica TaxID=39947 RepID=UPI0007753BD8|nr:protein DEHYDRATION-INDUCED 19 homolog 2 isoform X3 [Oryza sativa Japonica Group]KAF2930384.1 hypothetical protein DAI22_05g130900 [Oryza sativa Japonica Group]
MDAGDAWGRSSSSSSSAAAAARRLQARYDLYMGFDDADAAGVEEVEARGGGEAYNCPFCGEDFDFVAFCCHVDDEHAVEAKSGVCPICATRVGVDLIGHLTMQHGSYFKMQRRRRVRKISSGSHSLLSLLRKDLRDGSLQSFLGGSSYMTRLQRELNHLCRRRIRRRGLKGVNLSVGLCSRRYLRMITCKGGYQP